MPTTIRINGLVRLADLVRRELAATPIAADHHSQLRQLIASNLQQVEQALIGRGATASALAAPSRRAYAFLRSLGWQRLGTSASGASQAEGSHITSTAFPHLGRYLEAVLEKLASAQTPAELAEVQRSIDAASRRLEQSIARRQWRPEQLTAQARAIRGWLAYFAQPQPLAQYAEARRTLAPLIDEAARHEYSVPVDIHFRPLQVMFRLRPLSGKRTVLYLPTPMIAMEQRGFVSLVQQIFRPNGQARQTLHEQLLGEPCQLVQTTVETLGGVIDHARGVFRDLDEAFLRVNDDYFAGQMARPKLCWSRVFTGRKFGHYDATRDLIMLSRTLDQPSVEPFVVDFVLYHELLHKKHGVRWRNGRRMVHTADFLRDERLFRRHSDAEAVLTQLLRQ